MPAFYECQRCTACCRWPGQVRLDEPTIARLARFLEITEPDFIDRYTTLRPDRHGLALRNKGNGECVFLEGPDCRVQPVKPQQCRDFPNLWNFPGFQAQCQAREIVLSDRAYRERILASTGREPPDSR